MALTDNRVNGNNKSNKRDLPDYYYLHIDICTLLYNNMLLCSV